MDPNNMKPNSHKYKETEAIPKVQKVVKGTVTTKKRSLGRRFTDLFLSEDVGNVREYLLFDILIPTIKNGFVDMVQNGVEMLVYGRVKGRSRRKDGTYVSYSSLSSDKRGDIRERRRSRYTYDDVVFKSRGEAEEVLDVLNDLLDRYQVVTIANLYDAVGITGNGYTDNYYGWYDLNGAYISRCREGFVLNMPNSVEIER